MSDDLQSCGLALIELDAREAAREAAPGMKTGRPFSREQWLGIASAIVAARRREETNGVLESVIARLEARVTALTAERDGLREALTRLVGAKALGGIRALVAGWNGEDRKDGVRYERHPSRLGSKIPTTCGAVYELDEILTEARALSQQPHGGR